MTTTGASARGGAVVMVRDWALRHPVLFVLLVALAARLAVALFLSVVVGLDHDVFSDVRLYDRLAEDRADGSFHDWDARSEFFYDRLATYVLPLSLLYEVFGTHLFLGQLLSVVAGAVAAALICRLLLMVAATRWALFGGLVVALLPSQVVWSSTVFRDSSVWMLVAAMALVCAIAARQRGWPLLACGGGLAVLLFLLGHLRFPTMVVAAWALVLAAVFSAPRDRVVRVAGALVILVLLPWYLGAGPAGLEYVADSSPKELRAERSEDAESAFVDQEGGDSDLAHLPRGFSVMLLEPWPGTSFSGTSVRMAQLELVLWYPLLLLAVAGIPEGFRKRRLLTFSMATGGVVLIVYALSEGNFGTAFRHRGELMPPIAVLAALGAATLTARWRERRAETG